MVATNIYQMKHSMLCLIGVYLRGFADNIISSSFALKCESSEHLLSLYYIQIIYVPNPHCIDMTHVDWALKLVIFPAPLHITIIMIMGDWMLNSVSI